MDRKLIRVPDTQAGRFEACDALDIGGKRFIHVKRSSRRSGLLSHFFKQGSNSGQQFRRFQAAWNGLEEKVEVIAGPQARDSLLEAIDNEERKWRVEYWIIDVPRQNGEFNIPFFSKISLRDEVRNLRAMDLEVCITFIRMEPERIRQQMQQSPYTHRNGRSSSDLPSLCTLERWPATRCRAVRADTESTAYLVHEIGGALRFIQPKGPPRKPAAIPA